MAFEIEHDWQANLATPRARIGERAKNKLLIILCLVWVCLGLIGHQPWKPVEATTISIVKSMLAGDNLLAPVAIGKINIENPPLYYWSAAGFSYLFKSFLSMHDAARLATGGWMALTLLFVGMTGRELWGRGAGRQSTFALLGCLGLIYSAHLLSPEIAALTAYSMGFYALALANRRPYRAAGLLALSLISGFLATGFSPLIIILTTALILPIGFSAWRNQRHGLVILMALLISAPVISSWHYLVWQHKPDLLLAWWHVYFGNFDHNYYSYFLNILAWFALPAWPIALWGLWRYRGYLLNKPKFQLILIFFIVSLCVIGSVADRREIYALPLLLPIVALAGGSVETMKRGATGLLNWFGLILFSCLSFIIWLGWLAFVSGWPARLNTRMQFLSGLNSASINWLMLLLAVLATLAWLFIIVNTKRSNRAALTTWAVGVTMVWALLMTLWLPWIDSARSYQAVFSQLKVALPKHACVNTKNFTDAELALLHYHADIKAIAFEDAQKLECDIYIIHDTTSKNVYQPGKQWKQIWRGKRATDKRNEGFRMFKYYQ